MTTKRMVPLTGLAFVVVLVITFVVLGGGGSTPRTKASGTTIGTYYLRHHASAEAAAYLLPIAVVLLVIFAAAWPLLQQRSRIWSAVFFGGALVTAACLVVAAAAHHALAQSAHDRLDPSALQALNALDQPASDAFAAIAIMLLGAAGALLPIGVRRLRHLGYAAVVLALVDLSPAGTALFPITALWIGTVSVMLCSRTIADEVADHGPV